MPEAEETSAAGAAEAAQETAAKEGPATSVERTGPCERVIRIEADADYLRDRYQRELETLRAEVKLPGFRRGRAPAGLVERRMGSTVRSDLISSVVAEAYDKAVDESDLTVVAQKEAPDLEHCAWEPGQPAEFEFKCEVLPQVEVEEKDYKGLEVEVPALQVTAELLQQEMERFAQQFATWEEVSGPGIDWDDYVEAEVSVPEANWTETIGFYPRSERIGPFTAEGIKAALVGARAGEDVEVEGETTPAQVGRRPQLEPLAGQKVRLRLALKQVTRRRVPELDDELARKVGLSSAKEFEPLVRERLEKALVERKAEIARTLLVDRLLENRPCDLPPSLIERAAEEEQVRRLVRMLRMGVARQEAERLSAERAAQTRDSVERALKAAYLLRKVAEKERIVVTESEVDGQVRSFASRQGWREERAREYLEGRGMVRALRDDMRESKTVDFLVQQGRVSEIPAEEFARRHRRTGAQEAEQAASDEA